MSEENELIAEFMGFLHWPEMANGEYQVPEPYPYAMTWKSIPSILVSDLRFHTSWDWLMPVVEKIETEEFYGLWFRVDMDREVCAIGYRGRRTGVKKPNVICNADSDTKSKIKATYKSVVEFIKWYNSEKSGKR